MAGLAARPETLTAERWEDLREIGIGWEGFGTCLSEEPLFVLTGLGSDLRGWYGDGLIARGGTSTPSVWSNDRSTCDTRMLKDEPCRLWSATRVGLGS